MLAVCAASRCASSWSPRCWRWSPPRCVVIGVGSAFFLRRYLLDRVDARSGSSTSAVRVRRARQHQRGVGHACRRDYFVVHADDRGVGEPPRTTDEPRPADRPAGAAAEPADLQRRTSTSPYTRRGARAAGPLAGAGHRACRTAGCSWSAQQPRRRRQRRRPAALDRPAGRRRGADRAGRRSARRSSGPACSPLRRDRAHRRRRSPPATSPSGCPTRSRASRSPRPSWAGCPARSTRC